MSGVPDISAPYYGYDFFFDLCALSRSYVVVACSSIKETFG